MAAKKNAAPAVPQPLSLDKSMAGVLAMLVADREERLTEAGGKSLRKTELVLAAGGLQPAEIAPLVGKKPDAVRKVIERASK